MLITSSPEIFPRNVCQEFLWNFPQEFIGVLIAWSPNIFLSNLRKGISRFLRMPRYALAYYIITSHFSQECFISPCQYFQIFEKLISLTNIIWVSNERKVFLGHSQDCVIWHHGFHPWACQILAAATQSDACKAWMHFTWSFKLHLLIDLTGKLRNPQSA